MHVTNGRKIQLGKDHKGRHKIDAGTKTIKWQKFWKIPVFQYLKRQASEEELKTTGRRLMQEGRG